MALWSDSDVPAGPNALVTPVAQPADRSMPTIGHIGRYALKYQLGEGGLGTVYAAHDPLLSRLIAVKTLNVQVREDERKEFNAAFINEARAAGGLSHPHIVTVFDAGISDDRAYIAMELLKGRDLRQLRQEGWRATPAQAALIVRRVADALAFAHSKGVIHRDIKPANIFMVGRTQPRVLDFGIARVAHQRDSGDPFSGAGSPYYMSPEQMRREPADRRADVFSLGVVLYELLTDCKPFRGESLDEIRAAVLGHEPVLASKVDRNVPKALALIAARALAKDPEQRFRSARSFARELRQWLDANPAVPEGDVPPVPARRRRVPAAWAATAVVGAMAIGAVVWWQAGALPASKAATTTAKTPAIVAATATTSAGVASPTAAKPIDSGARAAAASAPSLSTAEAIVSASLGVIDTPLAPAAPVRAPVVAGTTTASPVVANPSTATPRESPKDRRAREGREREARERDARLATVSAIVAPATGTVKIAISPWGQVEVDGAASGAAPPLTELTLAEGRHQIVVRNGDYAPYSASVNVSAGQTVTLRYKFGS